MCYLTGVCCDRPEVSEMTWQEKIAAAIADAMDEAASGFEIEKFVKQAAKDEAAKRASATAAEIYGKAGG